MTMACSPRMSLPPFEIWVPGSPDAPTVRRTRAGAPLVFAVRRPAMQPGGWGWATSASARATGAGQLCVGVGLFWVGLGRFRLTLHLRGSGRESAGRGAQGADPWSEPRCPDWWRRSACCWAPPADACWRSAGALTLVATPVPPDSSTGHSCRFSGVATAEKRRDPRLTGDPDNPRRRRTAPDRSPGPNW
jgi:hypothetical protein